jgi:hypothetical protein
MRYHRLRSFRLPLEPPCTLRCRQHLLGACHPDVMMVVVRRELQVQAGRKLRNCCFHSSIVTEKHQKLTHGQLFKKEYQNFHVFAAFQPLASQKAHPY